MKKILFATLLLSATFGLLGSCSKGEAVVAVNCEAKAKKVSDLAVAFSSDLLNKTKCQDYLNAGYDYLKSMAQELMNQGKEKKAQKILDFVEANEPKGDEGMMDNEMDNVTESIRRKTRKFPRR